MEHGVGLENQVKCEGVRLMSRQVGLCQTGQM